MTRMSKEGQTEMFCRKVKQENAELHGEVERLSRQLEEMAEVNRVLTSALERDRAELSDREARLTEAESRAGRLLMELERERALTEELRTQLSEAAEVEKEAAELNSRLDRIAAERSRFEAKISNQQKLIEELRGRLSEPLSARSPVDFTELEEEIPAAPPAANRKRPYGEPFKPADPAKSGDRDWLQDLPPF